MPSLIFHTTRWKFHSTTQQFTHVCIYSVKCTIEEIPEIFSPFAFTHSCIYPCHHRVANYMNILQRSNVASGETHYFPWFKDGSLANLLCGVKSWFWLAWLAEWISWFTVAMESCASHIDRLTISRVFFVFLFCVCFFFFHVREVQTPSESNSSKWSTRLYQPDALCGGKKKKEQAVVLFLCSLEFHTKGVNKISDPSDEVLGAKCASQ